MENTSWSERITEFYQRKEYRPVQVFILVNKNNEFLVVQSAKEQTIWSFPQGGINADETLMENMVRELQEEVGILNLDFESIYFAFHEAKVDFDSFRQGERGFIKGKYYFFTFAKYTGKKNLIFNPQEVINIQWLTDQDVELIFNNMNPEKRIIMEETRRIVKQLLTK
mgnify:CR=1 FL=1